MEIQNPLAISLNNRCVSQAQALAQQNTIPAKVQFDTEIEALFQEAKSEYGCNYKEFCQSAYDGQPPSGSRQPLSENTRGSANDRGRRSSVIHHEPLPEHNPATYRYQDDGGAIPQTLSQTRTYIEDHFLALFRGSRITPRTEPSVREAILFLFNNQISRATLERQQDMWSTLLVAFLRCVTAYERHPEIPIEFVQTMRRLGSLVADCFAYVSYRLQEEMMHLNRRPFLEPPQGLSSTELLE